MVVLAIFEGRLVTKFHRLMRTEMHARQAELATVAIDCTFVHNLDVRYRTHFCADTATYTLVRISFRTQGIEDHTREYGSSCYYSCQTAIAKMVSVLTCRDVCLDLLQPRRKTLELPQLVIRVAPETNRTIIRHTDLMAVMQHQPLLF